MPIVITKDWVPHWKTKQALMRRGYSNQQYIDVGNEFLKRYEGEELKDPGSTFTAMFDKMPAHNAPKPDRTADKQQAEQRANNFANKSENSAEKAKEVKKQAKKTEQEQQSEDLNKLLINPSIADLRQYHQLGGACNKEFAMHWINHQRALPINHGFD